MYSSIEELPREKLMELLVDYTKNWIAHDGLWFQSIEAKRGMDEAMEHDINAWRKFAVVEANRIKKFLDLPDNSGIEGLEAAFRLRMHAPVNKAIIKTSGNTLTYKIESCRVQNARKRKGMPYHPCKRVGIVKHEEFAKAIDERFTTECISCYPDITDENCACYWRFVLHEGG